MSLNNISLSTHLLTELYQTSLIQTNAMAVPNKPALPFLGENKKNILILVNKKEVPYLPDGELAFLTTVLSACGLDLSQVAIVNRQASQEFSLGQLTTQFQPKQILLLDVDPGELELPASPLYVVQQAAPIQFVVAPALNEIEKTKQSKSQLWIALKQLFNL